MTSRWADRISWGYDGPRSTGESQVEEVSENSLWITYANVGGVGEDGSQKDTKINKWINLIKADIIGIVEVNYNWWFRDSMSPKEGARR